MTFIRYNNNPKENKVGDCVIRAIALALDKEWDEVYKDLCDIGFKKKRMPNDRLVYESYLKKLGYEKSKMPKKEDNKRYTVKEFAEQLAVNDKNYIISVARHLTCISDRNLYDTWNCSNKKVGVYYEIKR